MQAELFCIYTRPDSLVDSSGKVKDNIESALIEEIHHRIALEQIECDILRIQQMADAASVAVIEQGKAGRLQNRKRAGKGTSHKSARAGNQHTLLRPLSGDGSLCVHSVPTRSFQSGQTGTDLQYH